MCQDLFDSIGLQTSVTKYQASGAERGAFLDFIDYPLNNRWWLEDRFADIAALPSEAERLQQLDVLRTWEHPGPGSFYDDLGNIAKSPHLIRWDPAITNPAQVIYAPRPTYWWLDEGQSRARLSWLTTMESNARVVYEGLDPDGRYVIRVTGYGESLLRADDQRLSPSLYNARVWRIQGVSRSARAGARPHIDGYLGPSRRGGTAQLAAAVAKRRDLAVETTLEPIPEFASLFRWPSRTRGARAALERTPTTRVCNG